MIGKEEEERFRAFINQQLAESGEYDSLKQHLQQRLTETGWVDRVQKRAKDIIRNKGIENVTVGQLMNETKGSALADVPPEILTDIVSRLQEFMKQRVSDD
ncbi:enhancer of yellow 2 transcription factor-like protein B-like protein [Syncephalis pseudoplumigaleata]|uniref:Transcription and mRNA export factor SUS1 n=1 Tax=Syncephalis pseudoplumigaleata TaxID=1712513 RepID=A0A4P9Z328_9FUNG|nr:enhancer of yellow 2 transcription factor-like protein B-like protein [Syncephalis pseudoplumigaleata]|eukprot:RKP26924.1 enhancer of yellow 2 transcription factor-like protein B-like protein [Syncephalis pseudoplumigaleata]